LEILATKAGVILEKKFEKKSKDKQSQIEILEEIKNFYQKKLEDFDLAKKYLEERKIFDDAIKKFEI
jgi:hypothetical protein